MCAANRWGQDRARRVGGNQVATADVDVGVHGQGDSVASGGAIKIAVHRDNAGNMRGLAGASSPIFTASRYANSVGPAARRRA